MRWIQTSRVSLQRLGTLLAVAAAASESRRATIEALGRSSTQLLAADLVVSAEQSRDVAEYVRRMHLWQRYEHLRGLAPAELTGKTIQAQDLWLADPSVPSASGAITDRVVDEPVLLAVNLRLVRANNHTLTDRGRSLRLAAAAQVAALRRESPTDPHDSANPMVLSPGAGLILLNAFLEADYDFVRATHDVAVDGRDHFSRADISGRMGDVCRRLREEHLGRVRTGEDRQRLTRLKELADSIDTAGDARTRGGARPPDQTSTVRLEPYVDLGLIDRTSRFDYGYKLSEAQRAFFAEILREATTERFVGERLVGQYAAVRNPGLKPVRPQDCWDLVRTSWQDLRSQMGYSSIDETLLLANARLIDTSIGYFELAAGRAALKEFHTSEPRAIRFTMARGGAVSYFKLSESGAPG